MSNTFVRAAMAALLTTAPVAADAAGWIPSDDPVIADATAEVVLFGGDVFLSSSAPLLTSTGTSAAAAPFSVVIEGGPGFVPTYELSVEDAVGNVILAGAAAYTHSAPGRVEWGFNLSTDATGLFGDHALAYAAIDPSHGDPLAGAIDAVTGAGLVLSGVSQVPVPAALPLLATALGGLAWVRRRRGGRGASEPVAAKAAAR